jgi:hypothetical protein
MFLNAFSMFGAGALRLFAAVRDPSFTGIHCMPSEKRGYSTPARIENT